MTLAGMRWRTVECPPQSHLEEFRDLDPLLVRVLYNRGITEAAAMRAFLAHRTHQPDDPFLLPGMERAVPRILQAIEERQAIAVYGDYDADGVTASVLLTEALRAGGAARVQPYIPHRLDEGYGLHMDALEKLASAGNRLVITVDCGIRGVDQVRYANRLGLDVIVTDHHSVGSELPPAAAVIDPKLAEPAYPDRMLAAVGVAFKLVQGLLQAGLSLEGLEEEGLLDLVALGTVADLAPLLSENRVLVHRGLAVLNSARRPGVDALLRRTRVSPGEVTATTVGFVLGPRINAAGRMAHASQAARLLITDDPEEARGLADDLSALNRRRQEQTREMVERAEEMIAVEGRDAHLLFAAGEEFAPGIVGLVASRLKDARYRPAIVAQTREDVTVGSCRSIPEFHITEALDQCGELLVKHGGHAAAAGFTVRTENLSALRERLTSIASERLSGQELTPKLMIDAKLPLGDVTSEVQRALARLEPCGYANPAPLLCSPDVHVLHSRKVGSDGAHLKLVLRQGKSRHIDAIAFRMGDKLDELQERMDIVYTLEVNKWQGEERLQLNVQDMRPAGKE